MEHITPLHILYFLGPDAFFTFAQNDFQCSFSGEINASFYKFSACCNRENSIADHIFLNFSKSLDKVNHALLLLELSALNLGSKVLAWIESFLCNLFPYWSDIMCPARFMSRPTTFSNLYQ